jgi:hypothetical protein
VKKSGRDEPIEVVIHICMETTQGFLKLCKLQVPPNLHMALLRR